MAAIFGRSCRVVFFGVKGSQLRSSALPLVGVCSQKRIQDASVIHTSASVQSAALTRGKNYTKHWFDERAVAIGLLACVPVAMVYPCDPVNYALGVLIPLHNYWGMHHIILDYVPRGGPLKFAEILSKVLFGVQIAGLGYINYKDVGICKLIALTLGL